MPPSNPRADCFLAIDVFDIESGSAHLFRFLTHTYPTHYTRLIFSFSQFFLLVVPGWLSSPTDTLSFPFSLNTLFRYTIRMHTQPIKSKKYGFGKKEANRRNPTHSSASSRSSEEFFTIKEKKERTFSGLCAQLLWSDHYYLPLPRNQEKEGRTGIRDNIG